MTLEVKRYWQFVFAGLVQKRAPKVDTINCCYNNIEIDIHVYNIIINSDEFI